MFVIDQRQRINVVIEELPESARKPKRPLGMLRDKMENDPIFPVIELLYNTTRNAVPAAREWNTIPKFPKPKPL